MRRRFFSPPSPTMSSEPERARNPVGPARPACPASPSRGHDGYYRPRTHASPAVFVRRAVQKILAALLFCTILPLLSAADIDEAYTLYNRGRYEAAAAALESLRDRGELEGPDLGLLGMCYLHLDRLEDARQAITMAGRLNPGNYTVLLARGNLFLYQEKYDEAEAVFRRADSFFPGRMEPRNGIAAAFAGRAFESLRAGDYEAAAEMAGRAWELQPENLKLLTARIAALRQTDRTEELRSAYRDYLEQQPDSADAHAGLGLLLYADGLKSDGLKSDGLTERGRTEEPLTKQAQGDESQGEQPLTKQAFLHLRQAVELDAADPEPFLILARKARSENNTAGARTLASEAVGKAVQLYNMYRMQAAREMDQGESRDPEGIKRIKVLSEQARRPERILEESLQELIDLYPEKQALLAELRRLSRWYASSSEIRTVLAEQLMEAGRLEEARGEWEALAEDFPLYYRAHLGLGRCHDIEENLTRAALSYRRALDLASDKPEVYRRLRELYDRMGKPDVYLQILEMQILKDKYNPLLYDEAAAAADALGRPGIAAEYRERAEKIRAARD